MRPFSIEKLSLLTAVRPPNRLTTSLVSRIRPPSATVSPPRICAVSRTVHVVILFVSLELAPAARRGKYARGPADHHDDEDDAEHQALVLGWIELVGEILPVEVENRDHRVALPQPGEEEGEALQHLLVEEDDDRRPDYDARDAADAAEDYHREDAHRLEEAERVRADEGAARGDEDSHCPGEGGAYREGPELQPVRRYAHRSSGQLVLAYCCPGTSDP